MAIKGNNFQENSPSYERDISVGSIGRSGTKEFFSFRKSEEGSTEKGESKAIAGRYDVAGVRSSCYSYRLWKLLFVVCCRQISTHYQLPFYYCAGRGNPILIPSVQSGKNTSGSERSKKQWEYIIYHRYTSLNNY
jgi:hypothetical protein